MSDHDQEQPQNAPAQHETVADLSPARNVAGKSSASNWRAE